MGESQSRSAMLQHQEKPLNSAYRGQGGTAGATDGNFNFLPAKDDSGSFRMSGGDENRNPVRPRNLGPLGRDPPSSSSSSSGFHHNPGGMAARSRLPCWSPLEPLPEIESGDDAYGRVPPDGAEEAKMEEEEGRRMMAMSYAEEKQRAAKGQTQWRRRSGPGLRAAEEPDRFGQDDGDEWGDSESDCDLSYCSGGSASSLNVDGGGGDGTLMGGWDRVGVGEPRSSRDEGDPARKWDGAGRRRSGKPESCPGQDGDGDGDQSSDSDEPPEGLDAVWTLRDRERFKAQEMEKHQVQLTMYRRLALLRWVRTLQGRVQEQQDRLQSSFDIILTHRKELLRMGAAAGVAVATAPAVVVE